MKYLPAAEFERVIARAAALANEGFDIPEVAELLAAEGFKKGDGLAVDYRYTYALLHTWKGRGLHLRDGIRTQTGAYAFRVTRKRSKFREPVPVEIETKKRFSFLELFALGIGACVFVFCLWAMTYAPGVG